MCLRKPACGDIVDKQRTLLADGRKRLLRWQQAARPLPNTMRPPTLRLRRIRGDTGRQGCRALEVAENGVVEIRSLSAPWLRLRPYGRSSARSRPLDAPDRCQSRK